MTTSNSNRSINQENRLSSRNPVAKKSCFTKNNIPSKKTSQYKERSPEETSIPRTFAAAKRKEYDKEKGALGANTTTLIRSYFNIKNPLQAIRAPEGSSLHRHAIKKSRGKFSS
jgi:hypothetical protein